VSGQLPCHANQRLPLPTQTHPRRLWQRPPLNPNPSLAAASTRHRSAPHTRSARSGGVSTSNTLYTRPRNPTTPLLQRRPACCPNPHILPLATVPHLPPLFLSFAHRPFTCSTHIPFLAHSSILCSAPSFCSAHASHHILTTPCLASLVHSLLCSAPSFRSAHAPHTLRAPHPLPHASLPPLPALAHRPRSAVYGHREHPGVPCPHQRVEYPVCAVHDPWRSVQQRDPPQQNGRPAALRISSLRRACQGCLAGGRCRQRRHGGRDPSRTIDLWYVGGMGGTCAPMCCGAPLFFSAKSPLLVCGGACAEQRIMSERIKWAPLSAGESDRPPALLATAPTQPPTTRWQRRPLDPFAHYPLLRTPFRTRNGVHLKPKPPLATASTQSRPSVINGVHLFPKPPVVNGVHLFPTPPPAGNGVHLFSCVVYFAYYPLLHLRSAHDAPHS
jgi:hypothetical protein